MLFQVQYYQNTKKYYENLQIQSDELHLTQSASLAEYLRNLRKPVNKNIFGNKSFITRLFPKWHGSYTDLYLASRIRAFIRQNVSSSEEARVYEQSIQEIIESFRFITELHMTKLPIFDDTKRSFKFFSQLTEELKQDPFVKECLFELTSISKSIIAARLKIQPLNKVYVHHFDYIDAPRMMLFHLLQQIGVEVIFCVPFNPQKLELFSSWQTIYEKVANSNYDSWSLVENSAVCKGAKFASYLDQMTEHTEDLTDVRVLNFTYPTAFKAYLEKNPISDQGAVLAVHDEDLNIYTTRLQANHFYVTSYGKFLLALGTCRKTQNGICFNYTAFVNMMTSGWVRSGTIFGEQALSLLIDLREYMEGIETFQDILERLNSLAELQEVSDVFDEGAKLLTGSNRLKKYVSNPFRAFSYVHRDRYNITVKQLIECTKDLARKVNRLLLGEQETRNISAYVNDLRKVYDSVKENWEPQAKEKIESLFSTDIVMHLELGKEEMFQFLALSLGVQSELEDCPKKIQNFDQLIGLSLNKEEIHVTGLSLNTFPWKSPEVPRFLDHTWLKKCIQHTFTVRNRDKRIHALVVDFYSRKSARTTALYALYHVLAYTKGRVTFSYIENLQEKDAPSIYLSVLQELYGKKAEQFEEDLDITFEEQEYEEETLDVSPLQDVPDLIWLDKDFCYRKFFLNAVIEQHPIYEQSYHQQQVFATISKLLSEQGEGMQEVEETIFPLFPHWTSAFKKNLVETNRVSGLREYKSYENVYYPKSMRNIQKLWSRYEVTGRYKARNDYEKGAFRVKEHLKELSDKISEKYVPVENGHHCRMCQYLHVCTEGEYPVDDSD
ncbi:hypothetical protein COC47_05020 [Bacillus cereus]|uniref:hypothetical protein n=1 Tax=Bacillus cereus TaxID=1396 RepID=UPI000BF08489|nr:hypothetical protein [Bacillus cereus]PEL97502.1 hypothetical protein CN604_19370 [Bacillus wiedmannii]PGB64610.1 hypothetical protein COM15_25450 [Bacillus wiedmannii]PGR42013.1 hypothetical protein COC47_05020 [Bacillus cereus]